MQHITIFDRARFTVIGSGLIRCEYEPRGEFCDADTPFAVNRTHDGCRFTVTRGESCLTIETDAIRLEYRGGDFSKETLYGELLGKPWYFGKPSERNLGGTLPTLDGVDGERALPDGLISRDGWFVIDDSGTPPITNDELGKTRRGRDIYLFAYGSDYKRALRMLFYVAGKPAMPRRYALGAWYSRWWAYTDEALLDIVREYEEHDFPLDVLVIDMDWHHHDWTDRDTPSCRAHRATTGYGHAGNLGWTGYSWNRRLIRDPEALLRALHEKGVAVTLNDHPHDGVRVHEDAYPEFMRRLGLPADIGYEAEFDASSKKYMSAFFASIHTPLEKQGVDFWWLDWQQDHLKPFVKGTTLRHLPWLNHCYYRQSERDGKRGLSFSRWGGFGDHRHPIYFSGDTKATWPCLAFEVMFTATSANVGLFYWGHDTGGFFGEPNAELYVRWTQFSALSACLRAHSERHAALDRRPWLWGDKETAIMRESYHLRSRLMPYIYSLAYRAYEEGLPMIMPLYYEHPDTEEAYGHDGEYFFGELILTVPVTEPLAGRTAVDTEIWIADGEWYDWFTGKRYGAGTHTVPCPLDRFPLLIRGGTPLPMQAYTPRMTARTPETLILRCYPGEHGSFTLYEDDGVTRAFERGAYMKTHLSYRKEGEHITVSMLPEGQGYEGMPSVRRYRVELMHTAAHTDDPTLTVTVLDDMTVIETPPVSANTPVCITVSTR
ncbi:MAG: DUF5110 domain-containing protein [Clostridia bacterium]|nr:DUF5110 domain-containing protein [Clostridia bacterium]